MSTYKKQTILDAMLAATEVYENTKRDGHIDLDYNKRVKKVSVDNCQLAIYRRKRAGVIDLIIAFRGSDEDKDWKTNFNFKKNPYGNDKTKIKIHSGFYELYQLVRDDIHAYMKDATGYNETFVVNTTVTGHSLGAAIATLCAVDLAYNNLYGNHLVCVPVASPRVGNAEFVKSYNFRVPSTGRVSYRNDTVCRVPLFSMNYRDVDKHLHLFGKVGFLDVITYPFLFLTSSPFDHYPKKYIEAFKSKYEKNAFVEI